MILFGHALTGLVFSLFYNAVVWGGAPGRFSLVWLWCRGHTEVGWYLGSTRNGVRDLS